MATSNAVHEAAVGLRNPRMGLRVGLWVGQVLLVPVFLMAGWSHATTPIPALVQQGMGWAGASPEALVRFIGISELAGAIGLVLPALTRIKPILTAWAALGLMVIMVLAAAMHVARGEMGALPINTVLGSIAAFVAWGRFRGAPIAPRV